MSATPPADVGGLLDAIKTSTVVSCTDPRLRILGLSLAGWNAVVMAALIRVALWGAYARGRQITLSSKTGRPGRDALIAEHREIERREASGGDQLRDGPARRRRLLQAVARKAVGEDQVARPPDARPITAF